MVAVLSQEWLDLQVKLGEGIDPSAPGMSAVVHHIVTGAPEGNVAYTTRLEDGRVVEASLVQAAPAEGEVDLTVTTTYEGAVRLARGEVEASAAYMQGDLKAEGDVATLFALLEASHHPAHKAVVARLADQTDF
jgi:hypothetical protein